MPLEIREALSEELDEAAAVMVAAYEEYRPAVSPRMWESYARDIADVRGRMPQSQLIVAAEEGKIEGAVTYYPPRPEGTGEG